MRRSTTSGSSRGATCSIAWTSRGTAVEPSCCACLTRKRRLHAAGPRASAACAPEALATGSFGRAHSRPESTAALPATCCRTFRSGTGLGPVWTGCTVRSPCPPPGGGQSQLQQLWQSAAGRFSASADGGKKTPCSTFSDLLQWTYAALRARRRGAGSRAWPDATSAPYRTAWTSR